MDLEEMQEALEAVEVSDLTPGVWHDFTDGWRVRLVYEADECASVDEWPDVYGAWQMVAHSREDRPAGFDGNAEKVWLGNVGPFWWQPPADMKRSDEGFAAYRQHVLDVATHGFSIVSVELEVRLGDVESPWSLAAWADVERASLGGVEYGSEEEAAADVLNEVKSNVELTLRKRRQEVA